MHERHIFAFFPSKYVLCTNFHHCCFSYIVCHSKTWTISKVIMGQKNSKYIKKNVFSILCMCGSVSECCVCVFFSVLHQKISFNVGVLFGFVSCFPAACVCSTLYKYNCLIRTQNCCWITAGYLFDGIVVGVRANFCAFALWKIDRISRFQACDCKNAYIERISARAFDTCHSKNKMKQFLFQFQTMQNDVVEFYFVLWPRSVI